MASAEAVNYDELLCMATSVHHKITNVSQVLRITQMIIMAAFVLIASCALLYGVGPRPVEPSHFANQYLPGWIGMILSGIIVLLSLYVFPLFRFDLCFCNHLFANNRWPTTGTCCLYLPKLRVNATISCTTLTICA